MKNVYLFASLLSLALPLTAVAQNAEPAPVDDTANVTAEPVIDTQKGITIQHIRPNDKRGLYIFEAPKQAGAAYLGFKLDFGGAFTQQYQSLDHENTAAPRFVTGSTVNQNELMQIGGGFNNAVANLYLDAQLARGIRVSMTTYLSSRHHQETWVKDGYILMDASPIKHPALDKIMEVVTLKVGHFEINYGDAHFRRTDNGNAIFNPFVGNLIMDGFTTEVGGEVYARKGPFLAMVGVTNGEVKGNIQTPDRRGWAKLGKLGVDQTFGDDMRIRLTGSYYTTDKSSSNTLYTGDRAGSRYYLVLENSAATTTAQAWSANIRPGFSNEVTAFQINPFVKVKNFELFGVVEQAEGKASTESQTRTWKQYAVDGVYRFAAEKLFVGGRYNTVSGTLSGLTSDVSVDRWQASAGWFVTPSLLMKAEYVTQKYHDFPTTDIRNGGKFNGIVVEGVVAF
jgi:hypothetical protein